MEETLPWKKPLDFGGYPDHVTLGQGWVTRTVRCMGLNDTAR